MRTLVIGCGNLGFSLTRKFSASLAPSYLYSKTHSDVEYWKALKRSLQYYDVVFFTAGCGSVEDAVKNPSLSQKILHDFPVFISEGYGGRFIAFSSNYAAEPERSEYASIQAQKERTLRAMSHEVIRVANLYGKFKKENTLIYKLHQKANQLIKAVPNHVIPTPTDWLADQIWDMQKDAMPAEIYPGGVGTIAEIASILGNSNSIEVEADHLRPIHIQNNSEATHWSELLKERLHWYREAT